MSLFGGDLDLALAAARDGEERGFAELWHGLQPAVLRYLQAVVGAAAEDVASQTWQEAAREVRQFRGDAIGFRVWLFRVARYRALAEVRRGADRAPTGPSASVSPGVSMGVSPAQDPSTPVPSVAVAPVWAPGPAATERALRLMARLPRDESEAVLLRVVAGLDVAQSAMVLGVRDEAARTATARGLRKLALIAEESARTAPADSEDGRRRAWSVE